MACTVLAGSQLYLNSTEETPHMLRLLTTVQSTYSEEIRSDHDQQLTGGSPAPEVGCDTVPSSPHTLPPCTENTCTMCESDTVYVGPWVTWLTGLGLCSRAAGLRAVHACAGLSQHGSAPAVREAHNQTHSHGDTLTSLLSHLR